MTIGRLDRRVFPFHGVQGFATTLQDDACPQCGHAAVAEPRFKALRNSRLLPLKLSSPRCPVVWNDDDCGLPTEPCGCRHSAHTRASMSAAA